jgi:hypothetical protein
VSPLPVILIELVLVFGGVLAFAWWQLRSVARDRQKAAAERADAARQRDSNAGGDAEPPAPHGGV